jgi:hypothetical protein
VLLFRPYPNAQRIHIILDNLNTHRLKSLIDAYGEVEYLRDVAYLRCARRGTRKPSGGSR